jgi:type IV pilus assembly protein PilX
MLILLTILALAEVSLNINETRIVTNAMDAQVAFQTAEGASNEALNNLKVGNYTPGNFFLNSNGLFIYNAANPNLWIGMNWTGNQVIQSFQGNSKLPAAYFIERLPSAIQPGQNMQKPVYVYRITTRAVGASGQLPTIIQTTMQIQQ